MSRSRIRSHRYRSRRALPDALKDAGYGRIASFDLLNGFRGLSNPRDDSFLTQLGLTPTNGTAAGGIDLLAATLERHVPSDGPPSALIVDFASRLITRNEALSPAEHQLFSRALILSHSARARPAGERRQPFFNTVIWIVDKEGDLPDWFLIGNPRIRHIPIGQPDHLAQTDHDPFADAQSARRPERRCRPTWKSRPKDSSTKPKDFCFST